MTDRAWVRYESDDPSPVSLPEYVNPLPSIVEPGDVFSVEASWVDDVTSSARFVKVDEPERSSPNASLTKAQLAEKLNAADYPETDLNPDAYTKAQLVVMADAYDASHPEPPVGPTDEDTEGSQA